MNDARALVKASLDNVQIIAPSEEFQGAIANFILEIEDEAKRRSALVDGELGPRQKEALIAELTLGVLADVQYMMTDIKTEVIEELDRGDLWSNHPSSPTKASELQRLHGISDGEAYDLLTWRNLIFPWIQKEFGMGRYEVTRRLGTAKMRRITPILKRILDPETSRASEKVDQAVESIKQRVTEEIVWQQAVEAMALVAREEGDELDEQVAREMEAIGQVTSDTADALMRDFEADHPDFDWPTAQAGALIAMAESTTHRDLEYGLSPERTPPIQAAVTEHVLHVIDEDGVIEEEGVIYKLTASLSPDQYQLLQRRFDDGRMIIAYQKGNPITNT